MHTNEELASVMKRLRMSGLLKTLDLRVRQAVEDNLSHPEFLYRLLSDEIERRDARQLGLRLKRARFEHCKTIDDFDFSFNTDIPKSRIIDLATCSFIGRRENIALVGGSGVGKSHIAQAIGHRACMSGHTVLFISAHHMLRQLRAARADNTFEKKMSGLVNLDLLIIDDLGLSPLKHDEPLDLYEVIRQRYERGSLIITSNRAVEEWYPLFNDPLLASAALDRFLHHSHMIVMEGKSYRNPPSKRAASGRKRRAETGKAK